jgi:acetyl esterase/lipase
VVAIGHSAGGQLAGWLAGRGSLPADAPGASPVAPLTGFVSQAGVLDLALALENNLGSGAVRNFLGGWADDPQARSLACPSALLPMSVLSMCVHGTADDDVPLDQSQRFVAAARRAGDDARLLVLPGTDHYSLIDVTSPVWSRHSVAAVWGGSVGVVT